MRALYPDAPRRRRTGGSADALASGLGWLSIGLGVAELLAPRALADAMGMRDGAGLVRAYGAREVATGVAILASDDPAPWVWARVAGDLLDLVTLGRDLDGDNPRRSRVGLAIAAVAGVAVLDLLCARALSDSRSGLYVAPDYGDRSGFPRPAAEMRGAAGGREPERPPAAPATAPSPGPSTPGR